MRDFSILHAFGIRTVREGARWHLIESSPRHFNFESLDCIFRAAAETKTELILDLLHFGWPDFLEVLDEEFVPAFGRFTAAVAQFIRDSGHECSFIAPVNEISFLAWGGGEVACVNPYRTDCADALKYQLVRAFITGSEILKNVLPQIQIVSPEPAIYIAPNPERDDAAAAESYSLAQYEAWDMITGRICPELGGRNEYLDILGVNFYDRNEWFHRGRVLKPGDAEYKPFRTILNQVWQRYQRPILVSETGTEGDERARWFNYVSTEVTAAMEAGVPVQGVCLYPIVNHPGWEDDRHCENGLLDYDGLTGERTVYWPLARAIRERAQEFGWSN